ncbi:MAG: hypothetical protein INQ03_05865 [Candidatus Heimdallarchaeota archaeon]|nr:hypothetical protein [Candidatus Heimdallarchaeota archaeon]
MKFEKKSPTEFILKPQMRDQWHSYLFAAMPMFMGIMMITIFFVDPQAPTTLLYFIIPLVGLPGLYYYIRLRKKLIIVSQNSLTYKDRVLDKQDIQSIRIKRTFKVTSQTVQIASFGTGNTPYKKGNTKDGYAQWQMFVVNQRGEDLLILKNYTSPKGTPMLAAAHAIGRILQTQVIEDIGLENRITDYKEQSEMDPVPLDLLQNTFDQLKSKDVEFQNKAILFEREGSIFRITEQSRDRRRKFGFKPYREREFVEISLQQQVIETIPIFLILAAFGTIFMTVGISQIMKGVIVGIVFGLIFTIFGLGWVLLAIWIVNTAKYDRIITFDPEFTSVRMEGLLFSITTKKVRNTDVFHTALVQEGDYVYPEFSTAEAVIKLYYPFEANEEAREFESWLRDYYQIY